MHISHFNSIYSLLLLSWFLTLCLWRWLSLGLLSLLRQTPRSHHHLRLCPLLANLDSRCHVLELSRVLHGLAEVGIDLNLLALLPLEFLELQVDLLLLLSLQELFQELLQKVLELFDLIYIED